LILFERGEALLKSGEFDLAGRRVAARAVPYAGEAGLPAFRFDPVDRVLLLRDPEGRIEAGPAESEAWRRAITRTPAGPILVGPANPVESVRGSARAAAEGARAAGRAIYLLDPEVEELPEARGGCFVALFSGIPDEGLFRRLEAAARRMPAGLLFPVIPAWTGQEGFLEGTADRCAAAGAVFLAGLTLSGDGDSRRRVVAARALLAPDSEEEFFDRVHHGDWEGDSARALACLRGAAAARGLASRPPRPRGDAEPPPNAAASALLEELAEAEAANEHRAALLRAAVRWLDERGRDVKPIVVEGNFRKIFPFGAEIAGDVERALGGGA
jgi:hypothetical protein